MYKYKNCLDEYLITNIVESLIKPTNCFFRLKLNRIYLIFPWEVYLDSNYFDWRFYLLYGLTI